MEERIHGLMEEVMKVARELFPEMTRTTISLHGDGYMSITALKTVEDEKNNEEEPFRYLCDIAQIDGRWTNDWSERHNQLLAEKNLLLRG